VPGGIPTTRTLYSNPTLYSNLAAVDYTSNDASAAINALISACGQNQYVLLPPGTYTISSGISFPIGKSNATLRGSGYGASPSTNTILKNVQSGGQCIHIGGSGWPVGASSQVSWTAGYAQGSTVLTMSSVAGFTVGQFVWLTQTDDPALIWSDSNNKATGINGNLKELHLVKAINSATQQITLDTPIIWTQWSSSLSPVATVDSGPYCSSGDGVENLYIDNSASTGGESILMEEAYGCWMLNVYCNLTYGYNITCYNLSRCEFRRVTFWDAQLHQENCAGLDMQQTCCACLIEDNIFYRQCPGIECDAACVGNAFLYNFGDQMVWMPGTSSQEQEYFLDSNHAPHGAMNLYEGNYGQNALNDGYHGSGSHFTFFRNRFTGYSEDGDTLNSMCVMLNRWSLYNNVVGNVLGVSGFSNVLNEQTNSYSGATDHFIYRLGFPNLGNSSFTGYRPVLTYAQDLAQAMQGLDEAVMGTAQWNTNGKTVPANTAGAVQGKTIIEGNWDSVQSQLTWNDPTIGAQAIPASLYYSSKPAYFNSLAFPPFDPTNPGNTTAANVPAGAKVIPAGYRFLYGTDPQ
jgi:hypothetical protein